MKEGKAVHVASDLTMKSNTTVGEEMFEMTGGKDKSTKVKFGFAKIVELTGDGETIEKVDALWKIRLLQQLLFSQFMLHLMIDATF